MLSGEVDVAIDDRILAEYREVLARPKFSFDARSVQDLLSYFEQAGVVVQATPLNAVLPDPDDLIFVEVAAAAATPLVSGNLRYYPPEACYGVFVLSPSAFIEHWQQQQG